MRGGSDPRAPQIHFGRMILRRLYLYLASAVALVVLAFGLSALGNTTLLFLFNSPDAQYSRSSLAGFTATVVVALPVWGVHLWFARRFAMRDPADRASAIRRLYLYAVCLASSIAATIALWSTISQILTPYYDTCPTFETPSGIGSAYCPTTPDWLYVSQSAWVALVLIAIWAFHYLIASRDRAAVGEMGASATLRRWYMYIALLVGLLTMLSGASVVIQVQWVRALNSPQLDYVSLASAAAWLLVGGLLWGFHALMITTRHLADDRKSTLRAVEGFIAVAVSIVTALVGASEILYYSVARLLGVETGDFGNDLRVGLAGPTSLVVVYGVAWFFVRRRLDRDAGSGEAARQAGIRRLYTNLAALVSLGALSIGAAGLLGTLAVLVEAPLIGVATPDWKEPMSRWVTLLVVGGVIWLAHWRRVPWLEERQALSRRLYLWAALLGSVLAVLGGGIAMLYVVFQLAFSLQPRLDDPANLAFGQALAVILVAAAVGVYHWRVMRSDAVSRSEHALHAGAPAAAMPVAAASTAALETVPARHFELSVVGATEDDIHQALAALPPKASYKLEPRSVDGNSSPSA